MSRLVCNLAILSGILCTTLRAETYYVDSARGNDARSGGSPSAAWKSIARVNRSSLKPGDTVLFAKGGVWRETLLMSASGSKGKPITFGAYGEGERPVITATDEITAWQRHLEHVWKAPLAEKPNQVFFGGSRGKRAASVDRFGGPKEWFWKEGVLYVHSDVMPTKSEAGPVEASVRKVCIALKGKGGLVFDGLHAWGANQAWRGNIDDWDSSGTARHAITVRHCLLSRSYEHGLRIQIVNPAGRLTGFEAHHNVFHDNGVRDERGCGIHLVGPRGTGGVIRDVRVHHNEAYRNKQEMVGMRSTRGAVVFENHVHDGGFIGKQRPGVAPSSGILVGRDCRDIVIRHNRIHNRGAEGIWVGVPNDSGISIANITICYNVISSTDWYGIHLSGAADCRVYNNVAYDTNGGIVLGAHEKSTGIVIKNNIFSKLRHSRKNGNFECNRGSSYTSDHNIWDPSLPFYVFEGGKWVGKSWQEWRKGGNDASSHYAQPLFKDPAAGNFELQPASPAIDGGIAVGLKTDFRGQNVPRGPKPDIGAYEMR